MANKLQGQVWFQVKLGSYSFLSLEKIKYLETEPFIRKQWKCIQLSLSSLIVLHPEAGARRSASPATIPIRARADVHGPRVVRVRIYFRVSRKPCGILRVHTTLQASSPSTYQRTALLFSLTSPWWGHLTQFCAPGCQSLMECIVRPYFTAFTKLSFNAADLQGI